MLVAEAAGGLIYDSNTFTVLATVVTLVNCDHNTFLIDAHT